MSRRNKPTRGELGRIGKERKARRMEGAKHPVSFLDLLMSLGKKIDFHEGQRILNEQFPAAARPSDIPVPDIDPERDFPTPPGYRR